MTSASRHPTAQDRLIARLESIAELSFADREAIRALPVAVRSYAAGHEIVREGERTGESLVVLDGMLYRYKEGSDGRRQVLAFHVPGDVPDLQTLHLPVMDHTLAAVTDCRIGAIPHQALHDLIGANGGAGVALWREALIDAAKFREWIANLGARNAYQRTAHLFCELYVRLHAVGLASGDSLVLPLTQTQLSEALGVSVVHINRTLQALRKDGLIALERRTLRILDWRRLSQVGDFRDAYLHMHRAVAPNRLGPTGSP